jgi:hypothetical protein
MPSTKSVTVRSPFESSWNMHAQLAIGRGSISICIMTKHLGYRKSWRSYR